MKRNYFVYIFGTFQLFFVGAYATASHPITSTIHTLEDHTKQNDHYLYVQQQCGILKQDVYRQSQQLNAAHAELSHLQETVKTSMHEQKKLKEEQRQLQAKHEKALQKSNREKKELQKQLAGFSKHTKDQRLHIASLKKEMEAMHEEKEAKEHLRCTLEEELRVAHQEIERHLATVKEHEKLQHQLAQARQTLKYPHGSPAHTLHYAAVQPNSFITKNINL